MHLEELVADFKYSMSQVEHHLLVFCSSFNHQKLTARDLID